MTTVSNIAGQIEQFLSLSHALALTRPEEQTLLSLDPEEWERWRTMKIGMATPVPPLLVRRLDYAIALLHRMVASSAPGTTWVGPGESRV